MCRALAGSAHRAKLKNGRWLRRKETMQDRAREDGAACQEDPGCWFCDG
jgi:hypothetical protein